MAISLPDARQLSDEVLQSLRLRALRGCELGYSEIEVAELLGLSRETVSRWWTAYVDHGLEALPGDRTGRPVGSGRTLNDGQAARLRTILNEKSPEEVGIASPLWTRRAVAELIRKEYGIDMPVRTVGEYLERWGYTAKVPRRHAKDQDPEEVRHWLEVTYPAIEARAAREDAEIHWCDETGAAADQQPRRGYAREGRPARIEVPDPHIRMNLISTISPCLGSVDVTPWRTRLDFPDCHYITVSSPSGGVGGFKSVNFNAFRTRRASGQPPLTPRRSGRSSMRNVTKRTVWSASIARSAEKLIPASSSRRSRSRCTKSTGRPRRYVPSLAPLSDDRSAASPTRP